MQLVVLVNITPAIVCYGSIVASQSVHLLAVVAATTLSLMQIPENGNYQKIPNK
jgi:hypothetical protein